MKLLPSPPPPEGHLCLWLLPSGALRDGAQIDDAAKLLREIGCDPEGMEPVQIYGELHSRQYIRLVVERERIVLYAVYIPNTNQFRTMGSLSTLLGKSFYDEKGNFLS